MNGKFSGGKGTYDNPYIIEDIYDFNNIRLYPTKSYKLNNNIDFSTPPFDKGFLPIPNFTGQLDGNGYKLLNIYINQPKNNDVGLFQSIDFYTSSYATKDVVPYIKNLVIENADVIGNKNVGILIGNLTYRYNNNNHNFMTYLDNIYVSGTVQSNINTGGLIGKLYFQSNNYNNTFAQNIQLHVTLVPMTNNTYNSAFVGYLENNTRDYMATTVLIRDCYIDSNMDSSRITPMANQQNVLYNYSGKNLDNLHKYQTLNVIVNKDTWNGEEYKFSDVHHLDTEHITKANLNSFFYEGLIDENKNKWRFWYNHAPELVELKKNVNLIYVPATKKYYTYKDGNFVDVTGYDFTHFKEVNNIEFNGNIIKKAIEQFTSNIKIVSIVDKANGIKLDKEKKISLTRDTANDYGSRYAFRTTFKFSELDNPIFSMRNASNDKS